VNSVFCNTTEIHKNEKLQI